MKAGFGHRASASCLLLFSSLAWGEAAPEWPAEWDLVVVSPRKITVTIDRSISTSGTSSVLIATKGSSSSGGGALMQATDADNYRGKRVRFSADLRTRKVRNWAGLWFLVVDANEKTLAFDNMQKKERAMRGDIDWQRHDIVLDVSAAAANIRYGIALVGTGEVWTDGIKIEVVDQSVPLTADRFEPSVNLPLPHAPPPLPRNLDFEQ